MQKRKTHGRREAHDQIHIAVGRLFIAGEGAEELQAGQGEFSRELGIVLAKPLQHLISACDWSLGRADC